MSEITYRVIIDGVIIATGMSIEHATILVKALFLGYYNEHTMEVTIAREDRRQTMTRLIDADESYRYYS